jgi:hypothetical protein
MSTTHQYARAKIYIWPTGEADKRLDVSDAVMAVSVSKSLGAPAGNFSVTLLAQAIEGRSDTSPWWIPLLYRTDLNQTPISIGVDAAGGIMFGLIESVSCSSSFGETVSQTLTITGRDLGAALAMDNVICGGVNITSEKSSQYLDAIKAVLGDTNPLLQSFVNVLGIDDPDTPDDAQTFVASGVRDVLDWVLKNVTSLRIPLFASAYWGTGALSDYLNTSIAVTTGYDDKVFSNNMSSYSGTVWGFLTSVLDADLYEIRLDSSPSADPIPWTYLVVRPKPFDEPVLKRLDSGGDYGVTWNEVKCLVTGERHHEIQPEQVRQYTFQHGVRDVFNHYRAIPKHELIGNEDALSRGLDYPVTDLLSVARYGLRAMTAHLNLVAGDVAAAAAAQPDYTSELASDVIAHRNRLLNWYWCNPFFETGTLTVNGKDHYRVGDIVYLPWRRGWLGDALGMRYYVESVSWSYSVGGDRVGPYTTTLQLSRGHNDALAKAAKAILERNAPASAPGNLAVS